MNIVLHGFGNFPVVFENLIHLARDENLDVEWNIILNDPLYFSTFCNLLGDDHVFLLTHDFSIDENLFKILKVNYAGDLYQDIDAEKRPFFFKSSKEKESYALFLFKQCVDFLTNKKIDKVFMSQVEGLDGKVLMAAARFLNIKVRVPFSCRNLSGTWIGDNDKEFFDINISENDDAFNFFNPNDLPGASNKFNYKINKEIKRYGRFFSFKERLALRVSNISKKSYHFRLDSLRSSFLNNLPILRDFWWVIRKRINEFYLKSKYYTVADGEKYIYFPLQYTPESSINTPAPYYVDQCRLVDLIRYNMPNDYILVIKEHPVCLPMRKVSFYSKLINKPGVRLVSCNHSSKELIYNSELVVTVTGTAALEALMMKKTAVAIGGGIATAITGEISIDKLVEIVSNPEGFELDFSIISKRLSNVMRYKYNFELYSPVSPTDVVLSQGNLKNMLDAIISC